MAKNSLVVASCVEEWGGKKWPEASRISIFGGVKNREVLMGQLRSASGPLKIKDVILVSHEGCEAYSGRKFTNKDMEKEALSNDLRNTRAAIGAEMPKLKVKAFIQTKKQELLEVE